MTTLDGTRVYLQTGHRRSASSPSAVLSFFAAVGCATGDTLSALDASPLAVDAQEVSDAEVVPPAWFPPGITASLVQISCDNVCLALAHGQCVPGGCETILGPYSAIAWYGPTGHMPDVAPYYNGYRVSCNQVPADTEPGPNGGTLLWAFTWCCCESN